VNEPTPARGDDVPDRVLEELLSAFSDDPAPGERAEDGTPVTGAAARPDAVPAAARSPRQRSRSEKKASRREAKAAVEAGKAAEKSAGKAARKQGRKNAKEAKREAKRAKKEAKRSGGGRDGAAVADDVGPDDTGVTVVPRPPAAPAPDPAAGPPPHPAPATPSGPSTPPASTIVIGGDDDDLPDIAYLDEIVEREDDPARGTISIGDDLDSTGAFDAVSPSSRSMDPRVRARRAAVKREKSRKRLWWALGVGGVVLVAVGVLAVLGSSLFAVETVTVQGAVYTDPVQLQAIVDDLTGEPVLLVDTLAAERALEEIPWVERAIVTTDFPNDVLIDIRERVPLASYQGSDGRFRVIDRDGRVLDVLDGQPIDYLLVTGAGPDLDPGAFAGAPYAGAAQLVGALPAEIRALTVSASVDAATGDLGLVLDPGTPAPDISVRLGAATGLDGKLARLLQRVRDGLDGIVAIDVSTNEVSITRG
jgi:cell division protein FtsQ